MNFLDFFVLDKQKSCSSDDGYQPRLFCPVNFCWNHLNLFQCFDSKEIPRKSINSTSSCYSANTETSQDGMRGADGQITKIEMEILPNLRFNDGIEYDYIYVYTYILYL